MFKSDALLDLYAIDIGSTGGSADWSGPVYLVSPEQTGGVAVEYVNIAGAVVCYDPFPVSAGGFELTGSNKLPQPKITFSNVSGWLFDLNRRYDDLLGFRLIRIRTFAKFLYSVDFDIQASYNPNAHYTPEQWYFNRKMEESNVGCVYELASVFDVEGIRFPRRRMYNNYCPFAYRGPECTYTGDQPTCPKTLGGCDNRFGNQGRDLRYGGFPTVSSR